MRKGWSKNLVVKILYFDWETQFFQVQIKKQLATSVYCRSYVPTRKSI